MYFIYVYLRALYNDSKFNFNIPIAKILKKGQTQMQCLIIIIFVI